MNLKTIMRNINRHIRRVKKIVSKILFYDITLVTKAHNEVIDAMTAIHFHDVPKYRALTDIDHGFRLSVGLLA